ncbi:MAG: hypothetical protein AVO34_03475 [Firmicutes bacterium ML8_F2]|nr:MAG: hypothetical protein AVO34_03475 [Firmicutes bacterium ML8_F2]
MIEKIILLPLINAGSNPASVLIEKITNAIDAVLEKEWILRGEPTNLRSPRLASNLLFLYYLKNYLYLYLPAKAQGGFTTTTATKEKKKLNGGVIELYYPGGKKDHKYIGSSKRVEIFIHD